MAQAYREGQFCWSELNTSNIEVAKKFYAQLFHWKLNEMPTPYGPYIIATAIGKSSAALSSLNPEEAKQGIPSHWKEYIRVNSVDETTARAKSAGAKVIAEPMDVMDAGRMSMVSDPTGAVISFWQANKNPGIEAEEWMHGKPCWYELMTHDVEKAKKFYGDVFGWDFESSDKGMPYTHIYFKGTKDAVGGMMKMPDDMKNFPSHWGHYFLSNDVDASTMIAKNLGGTICMEPTSIENVGKFSVVLDPTGASFYLFTPSGKH